MIKHFSITVILNAIIISGYSHAKNHIIQETIMNSDKSISADAHFTSTCIVGDGNPDNNPPRVSLVTPTDMNNNISPSSLIELVFNEAVDIPADAITIDCSMTGVQTFPSVLTTPVTSIIFDPVDFVYGDDCSITASNFLIHDTDGFPDHLDGDGDGIANGDDFVSIFSVNGGNGTNIPPRVSMVTPEDMSENISSTSMIKLVFNEPVDIPIDAITISCTDSGIQTFPSVLETPVTSTCFMPTPFTSGESCSITASAFLIHDVDNGDAQHLDGDGDGIPGEEDFESFFTVDSALNIIFVNSFE